MAHPYLNLLVVAVVCSAAWHHFWPRYMLASWAATATTIAIQIAFSIVELGYLQPLAAIAAIHMFVIVFPVSLLVGLPYRNARRMSKDRNAS